MASELPPSLVMERQFSEGAQAEHYDIAHFYSRPLTSEAANGAKKRVDMLDVVQEQRDLTYAIENAGRAVRYRSEIATVRAFEQAFLRTCRVLHFSGHGTAIGGIMVDSGKFNWNSDKFPLMTQPDASYHGVRWATDIGPLCPVAFAIRMRVIPLRNLGACISPDNAWMFLQGIETLPLRMERHCENALAVAKHLKAHPKVEWVRFPGLPDDPNFELNKKYLHGKGGSMVVFGIKGGNEAGKKFIESLKLFSHLANVGDAKSLAIHPATTTHSQLTAEQQTAGGITPELVRLSVGIEHIDDILADLDQAFDA
jgi:O-acetylhomoserine (thiol)-lyase